MCGMVEGFDSTSPKASFLALHPITIIMQGRSGLEKEQAGKPVFLFVLVKSVGGLATLPLQLKGTV